MKRISIQPIRVLGIDPGFGRTGYGIIEGSGDSWSVVTYGCIETQTKTPYGERLQTLAEELKDLLTTYQPTLAGVELLFFYSNAKTAMLVGQARGVILLTLGKYQIPIVECTPLQVKQAVCGYGAAEKIQVGKMVQLLLRLPQVPKPDDIADALAVALYTSRIRVPLI